ncbi:hypothetical protein [Pseudomonas monachiensis]|uniref:Uncharacterized protein n=1 Tax=Pseudomonas monachiensis TaxID=3060212 RepID=A0ABW9HB05_9PSED
MNRLEAADSTIELLRLLQGIGKEELALIGGLIQMYCVADTLCRGLIAMLREKRVGAPSDFAYKLNDADVLLHTRKEAERTGLKINTARIISAVETIEMHRVFRHTFSHWVVKRHVGGQHLVAISKNKSDAEKRDGIPLDDGKAKLMAFRIDALLTELDKVKGHCNFLSELHQYLEDSSVTC